MQFEDLSRAATQEEADRWEVGAVNYVSGHIRANTLDEAAWLAFGRAVNVVTAGWRSPQTNLACHASFEAGRNDTSRIVARDGCCGGLPGGTGFCFAYGACCPRHREATDAVSFVSRLEKWLATQPTEESPE